MVVGMSTDSFDFLKQISVQEHGAAMERKQKWGSQQAYEVKLT